MGLQSVRSLILSALATLALGFSYEDYAQILREHVDEPGMVDYSGLQRNRPRLDLFVAALEKLDPRTYEAWDTPSQIAFWINAYNALTLRAIIDHYPIQPSLLASFRFPRNSIRQIPGVWDELAFVVMGRPLTLDDMEHRILRQKFNEPRIHMALVCAARGCPPLRNEPYIGEELGAQLDDQTRQFLKDPQTLHVDRRAGAVRLSKVFDWYGKDFVPRYGTDQKFSGRDEVKRAVLNFIREYLDPKDRQYLEHGKYAVEYLDYDWSLNEQAS